MRILERSVFTDRKVFVSSLRDNKYLDDMEVKLYEAWFDPVVATLPNLVPHVIVYLRASPETCMDRLKGRGRSEETGIDLEYVITISLSLSVTIASLETPNIRGKWNEETSNI